MGRAGITLGGGPLLAAAGLGHTRAWGKGGAAKGSAACTGGTADATPSGCSLRGGGALSRTVASGAGEGATLFSAALGFCS